VSKLAFRRLYKRQFF